MPQSLPKHIFFVYVLQINGVIGLRLNMTQPPVNMVSTSSRDQDISALRRNLVENGFRCDTCHDDRNVKPSRYSFHTSRQVLAIRPYNGTFQDVAILKDASGNLAFSTHVSLPQTRLAVIVAMGNPRAATYEFLDLLASHRDDIHVIIWCNSWDLAPNSITTVLAPRNPEWTVIVDPDGVEYPEGQNNGTEHYRYMTHLSLFGDQLSTLNAFIQDDTQDKVDKLLGDGLPHNTGLHMMDRFDAILHAREPPHFMYLTNEKGGEISRTVAEKEGGVAKRCHNESFTVGTFLKEALLVERTGPIPDHVWFQHMESFIVSSARIRDVLPSKEAFGRILHRSEELKCDGDVGSTFESTWSFLFSFCGSNVNEPARCAMDLGTCSYGDDPANPSTVCA